MVKNSIKIRQQDIPITIIRNPTNLGQSRSLNNGLDQVDIPYLVQLDSDDLFPPFTLEVLIKAAKKQPKDVAVIYGNYLKTVLDDHGTTINYVLRKGRSYHDRYQFLLAKQTLRPRFYRTSALKAIGGWPTDDPYEGSYAEDIRVLLRLIERYRFHWIDQVLYIYHYAQIFRITSRRCSYWPHNWRGTRVASHLLFDQSYEDNYGKLPFQYPPDKDLQEFICP